MIYTVSFKPKNIDEIQRIEVDATDEKDAKEKVKQIVSGPVGEISIVSIVKGRHVVRGPKYFEALTEIKDELFDASPEVKESFNQICQYFSMESAIPSDKSKKLVLQGKARFTGASAFKYNGKTYYITTDGKVETVTGRKVGKALSDKILSALKETKEAYYNNNVTEYFARKSEEESNKGWIKALKVGERTLKFLEDTEAVSCILSGGDPFIWDENTEDISKMKTKLENQVKHIKKVLQSRGIKYFDSINLKGRTIEVFSVTGSYNDNVSKHIVIDIDKEENIRKEIRYIIKCQDKFIVDLSESEYKELVSEGFTLGSGWNGGYTIVTLSGLDLSRGKKYRK